MTDEELDAIEERLANFTRVRIMLGSTDGQILADAVALLAEVRSLMEEIEAITLSWLD